MDKDYVVRWRKTDGTWDVDLDNRVSLKDAKYSVQQVRVLVGGLGQIWLYKEAVSAFPSPTNTETKP